ncbi:MAG: NAD(P)H-dependent oxidoreductase [Phycisphaeraceae bacterium]|nr:NAD(P)H-dependent oxidoreductase [Phycisphaeraceae bacterium]
MTAPAVLAFSGSLRRDSWNTKLVQIAAHGAVAAGATVRVINLREYPLPLFNEDLEREEGPPAAARSLTDLFIAHDAFLIASPEYNSSVSAVLKNAIDWVSRPVAGQPPLAGFRGKVAGLMSTSTGALGGLRGLVHLRAILGNIMVHVHPNQVAVGKAPDAFGPDGMLRDAAQQSNIERIGADVVDLARRLRA